MTANYPVGYEWRMGRFTMAIVASSGFYRVARQSHPQHTQNAWEVVMLKWHRARTMPDGRQIGGNYAWPPSEDWGLNGWTYRTEAEAMKKFTQLVKHKKERKQHE